MKRDKQRGQTMVEFSLVGIPIIFVLISIFEISRGMWVYETLAYSVREGVRFASVHGADCVNNPPTVYNDCQVAPADIAKVIQYNGVGLDPATTTVTFKVCAAANCSSTSNVVGPCALNACPSGSGNYWPGNSTSPPANQVGNIIRIEISTPFRSMIAMFWPGSRPVSFGTFAFPASSTDTIKF